MTIQKSPYKSVKKDIGISYSLEAASSIRTLILLQYITLTLKGTKYLIKLETEVLSKQQSETQLIL